MRWAFWGLVLANLTVLLLATGVRPPAQPLSVPRPAVHGERMLLLSATSGSGMTTADRCQVLGPFVSEQDAAAARSILGEMGISAAPRLKTEVEVEGYRVLIGPLENSAAAEAMHGRLAGLGLRGHYVIRQGLNNAIALGFFSELSKAEKLVGELASKGVTAEIRVRNRETRPQWWLDLELAARADQVMQREWADGVTLSDRPCGPAAGLPTGAPVQ